LLTRVVAGLGVAAQTASTALTDTSAETGTGQ
jgi:hypothetical protein